MLLYIFYNNFKCTDTEKLAKYPCPTRTRHGRIRIQTCRICTQPKKFDFLFRARHGHGRTRQSKKKKRENCRKNLAFFPAIQGPSTHPGGETLTLSFSLSGRRTSSLLLAFSDPNIIFSRALVLGFSFVGLFCTVGTLSLIWALFG